MPPYRYPLAASPGEFPRHPLLGKTTRTLVVLAVALAVPYLSPRLRAYRVVPAPWDRGATPAEAPPLVPPAVLVEGEAAVPASDGQTPSTSSLPEVAPQPAGAAPVRGAAPILPPNLDPAVAAKLQLDMAIEDPTGHAMDAFYEHLAKTIRKEPGAVTRILHYGDSIITGDYISGTLRRRLQTRFGDAGHGWLLVGKPVSWYLHNDVVHKVGDGWSSSRVVGPLVKDGLYGLGGATYHGGGGATASFGTTQRGDYGRKVSRFDVYYLEQEAGGRVEITVDGKAVEGFSTRGEKGEKLSKLHSVHVPDGSATMTLKALGGDVRLFGVALERDVPGVVYDALGLAGGRAQLWETMDAKHWADQMALRQPALVVLQYGTNESEVGVVADQYEKGLGAALEKIKAAAPMASILVAAPVDRAEKTDHGILTKEIIVRIVELQRKVAKEHGCAFWNTFEAMGGRGSVARWLRPTPSLYNWDYIHPTTWGAEVIGEMFAGALLAGYEGFASTHPTAPKLP